MGTCIEHDQLGRHDGYGTVKYKGRTVYLHRLAYCEAKQIPPLCGAFRFGAA